MRYVPIDYMLNYLFPNSTNKAKGCGFCKCMTATSTLSLEGASEGLPLGHACVPRALLPLLPTFPSS